MRIAYARHEEMTEIDNVHGSADPILFKRLFENEGFQTPWRFILAAIIPPDGGIGHHCHNNCEQIVGGAAVSPTRKENYTLYAIIQLKRLDFFNFNVAVVG